MAGIFNGPPRGGTRGGRDQFNWENVKVDKDREYYLGASVKALTGRWQKGKDVYWYTREKTERGEAANLAREQELAAVKQREEQLMMEALGLKPKMTKPAGTQTRLGAEDMAKLLGGHEEEGGRVGGELREGGEGDGDWGGGGLGYNKRGGHGDRGGQYGIERDVLDGEGREGQLRYYERERRKDVERRRGGRDWDREEQARSRSRSPPRRKRRISERDTRRRERIRDHNR